MSSSLVAEDSQHVRPWARRSTPIFDMFKMDVSKGGGVLLPEWAFQFVLCNALMFTVRDGLTGSLRYYMGKAHLNMLWFVPDLMTFVSTGFLIFYTMRKNPIFSALICIVLAIPSAAGLIFMNQNMGAFFSGLKAFTPFLLGLCFTGRSLVGDRKSRWVVGTMFVVSILGILANPYIMYPWTGETISAFGVSRQATKLWWMGGSIRYGGLAGDSTMAAFMAIFCYFLMARYMKPWMHVPAIIAV